MKAPDVSGLIDTDWGDLWEELPPAPDLVARQKTTQITLRVPAQVLGRLKRVAAARSLPYHALARSWIAEGASGSLPVTTAFEEFPNSEQLNLKLDQDLLDAIKRRGSEARSPYHSLARQWLTAGLAREEDLVGVPAQVGRPSMRELVVLLLRATDERGRSAVRGITRLQKLLFVIEQNLDLDSHFYAYNYGPFNEEVNDAIEALGVAGMLRGRTGVPASPPTFAEMMEHVQRRSGPASDVLTFALNERGTDLADRLIRSESAYERIYARIESLRREWDNDEIVERVYEAWPEFAEKSVIRDEVDQRRRNRRRDG